MFIEKKIMDLFQKKNILLNIYLNKYNNRQLLIKLKFELEPI